MRNVIRAAVLGCLAAAVTGAGCTSTAMRNRELEQVAKDWCMTIRASQVIPVYPLTEDLQPGDVLLVRTPIQEQQKEYKGRGFLPLDQLLYRTPMGGMYDAFYGKGYGLNADAVPPRVWQFPNPARDKAPMTDYAYAPRAAFPSYKFSVRSGGGINAAIPVQGIPVGLTAMGASSGDGSITISDVYTYGVDDYSLRAAVSTWVGKNKDYLGAFLPPKEKDKEEKSRVYLRVVSRVYLTGGVNILLNNSDAMNAGLSVGDKKPVSLFDTGTKDAAENYTAVVKAVNDAADAATSALPGATVKVAAASSRSVSLVETFPRPLVIGYVGFDIPLFADGSVGAPVSTQSVLEGRTSVVSLAAIGAVEAPVGDDPVAQRIWTKAKLKPELLKRVTALAAKDWDELTAEERTLLGELGEVGPLYADPATGKKLHEALRKNKP